jgi:hypothetical protein
MGATRVGLTNSEKGTELNRRMGNPQTFFSSGKVSLEETYELTIQIYSYCGIHKSGLYSPKGQLSRWENRPGYRVIILFPER